MDGLTGEMTWTADGEPQKPAKAMIIHDGVATLFGADTAEGDAAETTEETGDAATEESAGDASNAAAEESAETAEDTGDEAAAE